MKKDKTSYINEQREALQAFIENQNEEADHRVSANSISRSLGISGSQLSQFMNCKYTGNNLGLAKKIEGLLQRQKDRENYTDVFYQTLLTKNVKDAQKLCRICHLEGEIGILTGEAGLGKTRGVKKYTADNEGAVILIEVVQGMSTKVLMQEINKACGFSGEGTLYHMFLEVKRKLNNSGRLLIIDEAELLPVKALELARRIHDMTGIGVVLCGLPRLLTNLIGLKSDFKQLYSRVGIKKTLKELEEEDFELLVQNVIPGSNGLWKKFYKRTSNARALEKLLKNSIKLAEKNDCEINDEIIENAMSVIII